MTPSAVAPFTGPDSVLAVCDFNIPGNTKVVTAKKMPIRWIDLEAC
jgi:hypothetical protein